MRNFLKRKTENANNRREQRLLAANQLEHKTFNTLNTDHGFIESFSAAPSFLVFLWACFPLLLIASFSASAILAGVIATVINIILLQIDTFDFIRIALCTMTLIVTLSLYHFGFF